MADTSYIEQILLGTALQGVPHKPPRQKKPSWTSETAGGQTQHRRGNSKASSQHPSTSAGPSTAPPAEPLSRPSSRSTPKLFHCEACDVWLPCKPLSNWDVHVAGIRHRRQLLSLREHGRRDRLVLSVFESDPAQQSSGTRDPASRLAAGSESVAESSSFPWAKEVLTALKAQFLGLHGHGRQYDSVFRRLFTPKNLHLGYLDLQNLLAGAPRGAGYESTVVLTDLAAFKDEQREASVLGVAADNLGRMTWPAGVAIAYRNEPTTDLYTAWLTGACLFINALAQRPSGIRSFLLRLPRHVAPTKAPSIKSAYGHLMQACHNLLESNSVLEKLSIRIANPPDADPLGEVVAANPPDGELLEEAGSDVNWASEEDLQVVSLEEVARATALRTRLAVMMGLHPRAGRLCPLRILPEEVLERILDFVVPKRGCKVEIVLSDEFPYFERQGRAMTFSPAY